MTPFGGRGGDERKSTLKEEDGAHTGSVDSAAALSVRRRSRLGKGRKRHGNGAGNTIPRQQGPRRRETARAQEAGKRWQQWGGGGQREKEVGEQGTDQQREDGRAPDGDMQIDTPAADTDVAGGVKTDRASGPRTPLRARARSRAP